MRNQQAAEFAHTQTAAVENLEYGFVAHALRRAGVHSVDNRAHFVYGQHGRQIATDLGRVHHIARVILALAFDHEPVEKRRQGAEFARLRALGERLGMRGEEGLDVL